MIKSKKQMFIIIAIAAVVIFLGGSSYAWFTYSSQSGKQEIITGDFYFTYNEGDGEIELSNVFPETAEEARARNNNYITFTVDGVNTTNKDIYYEFILDYGTGKAEPKSRYRDQDLRFDLVALDNNGDEVEYLLSDVSYSSLINQRI